VETPEAFRHRLRRSREQCGKTVDSLARSVNLSRSQLSNVEGGRKFIDRRRAEDLDRLLGAEGALIEAWEIKARELAELKRRTVMKLPLAVLPTPFSGLHQPLRTPKRVTPDDLAEIGVVSRALVAWDNAFGGGQALDQGRSHLEWAQNLLRVDCPSELRPGLFGAVGNLAQQAAFMAFDAFAHSAARELFRFSLDCSEVACDVHLRTAILSSMARQEVWCGKPREALTYLDEAVSYADRLTATEHTEITTVRARAYAKLGPEFAERALSTVGQADELFADSDPSIDPTWVDFYDSAQHHGDTAHALFDVAMQGRRTDAAERFRFAVSNHRLGYTRSRTISQIKLATLIMASGDPQEAASIGQEAVDPAARLKSHRTRTDLVALRTQAAVRGNIAEAGELVERIDEAIGS